MGLLETKNNNKCVNLCVSINPDMMKTHKHAWIIVTEGRSHSNHKKPVTENPLKIPRVEKHYIQRNKQENNPRLLRDYRGKKAMELYIPMAKWKTKTYLKILHPVGKSIKEEAHVCEENAEARKEIMEEVRWSDRRLAWAQNTLPPQVAGQKGFPRDVVVARSVWEVTASVAQRPGWPGLA